MEKRNFGRGLILVAVIFATFFCGIKIFSDNSSIDKVFANESIVVNQLIEESYELVMMSDPSRGEVTGQGNYAVGSIVTINAVAKEGFEFSKWQVFEDGDYIDLLDEDSNVVETAEYSFVIERNYKLKPIFIHKKYMVDDDFGDCFQLTNVTYDYDETRFTSDEIALFDTDLKRPIASDFYDAGSGFYYSDTIDLEYTIKDDKVVKSLNRLNFSTSLKNVAVYAIDDEGYILWEEIGVHTDYPIKTTLASTLSFNYNRYVYFIITQQSVGGKSITTKVNVKLQIDSNVEVGLNAEELNMFTIKSYVAPNAPEAVAIETEKVKDLISYNYDYYGILEETEYELVYLVSGGASFSFDISSNDFYRLSSALLDGREYIVPLDANHYSFSGKLGSTPKSLDLYFEEKKYDIKFESYYLDNGTPVKLDENLENINDIQVKPNISIGLDMSTKMLTIGDQEEIFTSKDIYGYSIYCLSVNLTTLEPGYNINVIMSNENPTAITIFLVYQKIDYTIHYEIVDKNSNISPFFAQKTIGMNNDETKSVGDNISLVGTARQGFKILGWKLKGTAEFLEQTNFEFVPSTNDSQDVYYQIVVDYDTINVEIKLDSSSFTNETPMSNLGILYVNSIKLNTLDSKFELWGYNLTSQTTDFVNVELASFNITGASQPEEGITNYQTSNGEIIVQTDELEYIKLTFNGRVFNYNQVAETFELEKPGRDELDFNINNDFTNSIYELNIANAHIDDLIYYYSDILDETKYNFMYYTYDKKYVQNYENLNCVNQSDGTTRISKAVRFNRTQDSCLLVVCATKQQNVTLIINNINAYDINQVANQITAGESIGITFGENSQSITANSGTTISIIIYKDKIANGYEFVNFTKNDPVEELGHNDLEDSFVLTFPINNFIDQTIHINFSAIVYTVNLNADTGIEVYYKSNPVSASFNISYDSILDATPTLQIKSQTGRYISLADFIGTETLNVASLLGTKTAQTDATLDLTKENFETFILNISIDNQVELHLQQEKRTYHIYVKTVIDDNESISASKYLSDAEFGISNIVEAMKPNIVITPKGTIYGVSSDEIEYDTDISLTIDDSLIDGVYFAAWANFVNLANLTTDSTYALTVTDNVYLTAKFNRLNYSIKFHSSKLLDETIYVYDLPEDQKFTAQTYVNNTPANNFYVNDKVLFRAVGVSGYELISSSHRMESGDRTSSGIVFKQTTDDYYEFAIGEYFSPSVYIYTDKSAQILSPTTRIINIYLEYKEKQYSISVEAKQVGEGSLLTEVSDWIDKDNLIVKYKEGVNYYTKPTNPGEPALYFTDSELQVCFATTFNGITLKTVQLGGSLGEFNVTNQVEYSLANQIVGLIPDKDKGFNYYSLTFKMNTEILSEIGTNSEFKIILGYSIKTYNFLMNVSPEYLTKNVDESNPMSESYYNIVLSYNKTISGATSNRELSLSSLYYDSICTWGVNSEQTRNEFNNRYLFDYFLVSKYDSLNRPIDSKKYAQGVMGYDIKFELSNEVWSWLADSSSVRITACYKAKVALGDRFVYYEDKFEYVKTVEYNGGKQPLISSANGVIGELDVIFDYEVFDIKITYSPTVIPKNVGTYYVDIVLSNKGANLYDYRPFEDYKVILIIQPKQLSLEYTGVDFVEKVYDGTREYTNHNRIISNMQINGLQTDPESGITDVVTIDLTKDPNLNNLTIQFASKDVAENIDISINNISLVQSLIGKNYIIPSNFTIYAKGKITPFTLDLAKECYIFKNKIVFKEGISEIDFLESEAETLNFSQTLPSSTDKVALDKTKVIINLLDNSIGLKKVISVKLSEALIGEDKSNYKINDTTYTIDIYPYSIKKEVANVGTFYIMDKDELCIIPTNLDIDKCLNVAITTSTSPNYSKLFGIMESHIGKEQSLYASYEFRIVNKDGITIPIKQLKGAYVLLVPIKDVDSVYNVASNSADKTIYQIENKAVCIKIDDNVNGHFCVLVTKSYFAVWKIILIIGIILLIIIILIILFIIFKKKLKERQERRETYNPNR